MIRALSSAIALLMLAGTQLDAQQPAATFSAEPIPAVTLAAGNVVRVTYRVQFTSTATDTLAEFAVRSPVALTSITPGIVRGSPIFGLAREGDEDAASWGWIRNGPADGQTSAPVSYEAVGLPGIVQYRATRWVPPREALPGELDQNYAPISYDTPDEDQVIGKTVGVVPMPDDMSPEALTRRADALAGDACALGWIDNAGVCNSLRVKIREGSWNALMNELDGQRGKHVNDSAYFLLYATAQRMRQ